MVFTITLEPITLGSSLHMHALVESTKGRDMPLYYSCRYDEAAARLQDAPECSMDLESFGRQLYIDLSCAWEADIVPAVASDPPSVAQINV